jgi:hypothetical protein
MNIEETHPYDPESGYHCPNEAIKVFMRFLARGKYRPRKVLSICSGGEVPLLCFLPIAVEVIAIDHSKRSLETAYAKIHLISQLGVEGWYDLLKKPWNKVEETWRGAVNEVPASMRAKYHGSQWSLLSSYTWSELQRFWAKMPRGYLRVALKRLDRITFIHGDLRDAAPRGPFDMIYLSNALEHSPRDKTNTVYTLSHFTSQIEPLLAEGGRILLTGTASGPPSWQNDLRRLTPLEEIGWWNYHVYEPQKKEKAA